jgi:hypothetical protein
VVGREGGRGGIVYRLKAAAAPDWHNDVVEHHLVVVVVVTAYAMCA